MHIQLQVTVNKMFKTDQLRISNIAKEKFLEMNCLKFTNENDVRLKSKIYPKNKVFESFYLIKDVIRFVSVFNYIQ